MIEAWRSVVGYEGYYEVSDDGMFRGINRMVGHCRGGSRRAIGIPIVVRWNRRLGQTYVQLSKDGVVKTFKPGRLVLEAFVGQCPDGMECCHIDDDKRNNRLDNLRWGTHLENCEDRFKNGKTAFGKRHYKSYLSEDDVRAIRKLSADGFGNTEIAEMYNTGHGTVYNIKKRKTWKYLV